MALQWSWAVVEMCSFKLSSSREPGGGDGERERGGGGWGWGGVVRQVSIAYDYCCWTVSTVQEGAGVSEVLCLS